MLVNKVKKFNNLEVHLSYNVLAGKPPDEIIKFSDESDIDLIVMASSRISSTIRVIGSTVRKVIDSTRKPVLVIHEYNSSNMRIQTLLYLTIFFKKCIIIE